MWRGEEGGGGEEDEEGGAEEGEGEMIRFPFRLKVQKLWLRMLHIFDILMLSNIFVGSILWQSSIWATKVCVELFWLTISLQRRRKRRRGRAVFVWREKWQQVLRGL